MDLKIIKQVVDLMKRSDLTEFEIEETDLKLRICRRAEGVEVIPQPQPAPAKPAPESPRPEATAPAPTPASPPAGKLIKSPMVGTFYRASNPDSAPFVDINTQVKADTVVCIIEAMKVMNEIQAEVAGQVVEILVENGESVEYGQPLFRLK